MDQPTPEWAKDPRNAFIETDGLERVDTAISAAYDQQTRDHILKPLRVELDRLRAAVAELVKEGELMMGNWTNVKARDRFSATLAKHAAAK